MTDELCTAIKEAVKIIKSGAIKRVDADDFIAYRVGEIIRVDIKQGAVT